MSKEVKEMIDQMTMYAPDEFFCPEQVGLVRYWNNGHNEFTHEELAMIIKAYGPGMKRFTEQNYDDCAKWLLALLKKARKLISVAQIAELLEFFPEFLQADFSSSLFYSERGWRKSKKGRMAFLAFFLKK